MLLFREQKEAESTPLHSVISKANVSLSEIGKLERTDSLYAVHPFSMTSSLDLSIKRRRPMTIITKYKNRFFRPPICFSVCRSQNI